MVRDANMGHQLVGGNSSWCLESESRTTHRSFVPDCGYGIKSLPVEAGGGWLCHRPTRQQTERSGAAAGPQRSRSGAAAE